ncbi:efflux RND transporter periplasmic adaptor subunit [Thalassomonas haliotis]|uniref:Efflux RND transporter periplasmic adaptor subunit n=1 Tax=Thalassomonas haliotis TaxID=485448 RepID=A0ABY7VD31_9GAMM|nr:efflux RND transporter periplasmic adaptor subunit [Thalassomonas haliotis]WDE11443.1 efflux RND transporter periplasmic adaptor subunit [Thalassomonas haliotis]
MFSLNNTRYSRGLLFSLVNLLLLFTLSGCKDAGQESSETTIHSARMLTISPEAGYPLAREYIGELTTKQHTDLGFEFSGKINSITFDSGDEVRRGDLLASQDTELLTIKHAELAAKIQQNKAQITLNQANLKRIKSLINNGYTSEQSLDELNAEYQVLQAGLQGLNASLKTIEYQIEKARLLAPFDATIGERFLSQGQVLNAGQVAFRLIAQNNNEISVGVPAKLAARLRLGDKFSVAINDNLSDATLVAIGKQVDKTNRTVQLRLLPQENTSGFNGQLVRVNIRQEINKSGYWLPLSAITDGVRGQWNVYLAQQIGGGQYQIKAATVAVLHTTENDAFVSGLEANQHLVIAEGLHRYVPGQIISKHRPGLAVKASGQQSKQAQAGRL